MVVLAVPVVSYSLWKSGESRAVSDARGDDVRCMMSRSRATAIDRWW